MAKMKRTCTSCCEHWQNQADSFFMCLMILWQKYGIFALKTNILLSNLGLKPRVLQIRSMVPKLCVRANTQGHGIPSSLFLALPPSVYSCRSHVILAQLQDILGECQCSIVALQKKGATIKISLCTVGLDPGLLFPMQLGQQLDLESDTTDLVLIDKETNDTRSHKGSPIAVETLNLGKGQKGQYNLTLCCQITNS